MKQDLLKATRVVNGQVRCPRCKSLLGKIYYGGGATGFEVKCKSCRKLVMIEAAWR